MAKIGNLYLTRRLVYTCLITSFVALSVLLIPIIVVATRRPYLPGPPNTLLVVDDITKPACARMCLHTEAVNSYGIKNKTRRDFCADKEGRRWMHKQVLPCAYLNCPEKLWDVIDVDISHFLHNFCGEHFL